MSWRTSPVTLTLIAINVIIYVVDSLSGNALLKAGAVYPPAIQAGEWWRLITAGFLHFNIAHIGSNMFALYIAGTLVEYCYGSARYSIIYAVGLVAGNLLAYYTTIGTQAVSAGASGAILGIFGAMVVLAFKLPRVRGVLLRSALLPIGLTIFSGFVNPNISMAAHVGGLIGGGVTATLFNPVRGRQLAPVDDEE